MRLGEYFDQILYNFFFKGISLYRTILLKESYIVATTTEYVDGLSVYFPYEYA